jgi:hypothetical protein
MRLAKHADRATGRQQCKGDQSKLHGRPSFGRRNISGLGKKPPLTISTVTGALRATRLTELDRRAWHRSVGAKHTAVTGERLESVSAAFAIVKELAGICGHLLGGFMTAFRASYDRNFKHLIQLCRQRSAGQRWRVMKRLISSGDEKTMDARSPIIPALTIAGDLYSSLPRQFLVA